MFFGKMIEWLKAHNKDYSAIKINSISKRTITYTHIRLLVQRTCFLSSKTVFYCFVYLGHPRYTKSIHQHIQIQHLFLSQGQGLGQEKQKLKQDMEDEGFEVAIVDDLSQFMNLIRGPGFDE